MNNKTYTILQSFDKYEVNRLRKFLQSPYFNMNDAIVILFEIFIKNVFGKKTKALTKEVIWREIYGKKNYDDVRFRKLNSELLKLVEKFLAQQIYEENPIRQAVHLMEAVGQKKLEKLYNSTVRTARRLSNQQKFKPANFYFYQYEIEKNYFELTDFETNRGYKSNLEEIAQNLDYFYLAEKLRIYNSMVSRKDLSRFEYNFTMIDEILLNIKNNEKLYLEIPPVQIYYQTCLINKDFDNEKHYYKLKELIDKHISQFPISEAKLIAKYVLNYSIYKTNKGETGFVREYFESYKNLLEKGIIFEEKEGISPWQFNNTIFSALRLGEYNWVEKFIEKYSVKIPFEFRENSITFNLARLNFYQKKYDDVIRLLNQVEYKDLTYNLNSKLMLIAVYYETDEIEPLYHLFESFRVYLNRNKKVSLDRKKRFLNLIKFTKKLTKLMPGDKKSIEKLKTEIAETQGIINLKWLKEKIAELE